MPRRATRFFGLVALLGFIAAGLHSAKTDDQIRSKEQDLKKIKASLSKKKSEKAAAKRKEKELSSEVTRIKRELRSAKSALDKIEAQVRETEKNRTSTEERLWASSLKMGQWNKILSEEMSRYYVQKMIHRTSEFVETAYRRAMLIDKINGLSFAKQHHAYVQDLRDELVTYEVELQKLRLNKEHEQKRVQRARQKMEKIYKTVRGRRVILEQEIRDLNASAKAMSQLIEKLIKKREKEMAARAKSRARGIPSRANRHRGHLSWPVEGKVVERYGKSRHPELDTYVFSNGIKLQTSKNKSIRAIENGEVLYAGEFMSYGLMALVQHPDNLHGIYAHLGELKVKRGQKVSVGEVVGTSGEDKRGNSLCYFELRVGGVAVDPLVWLK